MDDLEKLKQQMGGGTFTLNLMTRALKKFAASKGIKTSKYSKKKSLLKRKKYNYKSALKFKKQRGQM
jgi:molecular chaperone DnaK (HSP70)